MSKERALRRAERESARAAAEAVRTRRDQRRSRRRALIRRLVPQRGRRAWLLPRRSAGQRAAVLAAMAGVLWLIWYLIEPWPLRIGASLLFLMLTPVFIIIVFDRRM